MILLLPGGHKMIGRTNNQYRVLRKLIYGEAGRFFAGDLSLPCKRNPFITGECEHE